MNDLDFSVKHEVRPSTKISGLEMAGWRVIRREREKNQNSHYNDDRADSRQTTNQRQEAQSRKGV